MATSKKKTSGTDLRSTTTDPLIEQLKEIFAEYPDGVAPALNFLLNPSEEPFLQLGSGENTWRVRATVVDRYIDGVTDRVKLWTKNSDR